MTEHSWIAIAVRTPAPCAPYPCPGITAACADGDVALGAAVCATFPSRRPVPSNGLPMTRTSPAVDRVAAVLKFFAEHPQQPFTLSQVIKATKMPRATCHLLLVSLSDHGFLFRNPDKSYVLGPTLLAIGKRAQGGFSPLDVARQEMRLLSDELDVVVCVQHRDGDEVVTSEYSVSISNVGTRLPGVTRTSLHPWGAIFLAPLHDSEVEASFASAVPPLTREEADEERRQVEFARAHGFVFAVQPLNRARRRSIRGALPETGDFITTLAPASSYDVQFLLAPVMDEDGRVAFLLALTGFAGRQNGSQIERTAARVQQACARITSFIVGKQSPA